MAAQVISLAQRLRAPASRDWSRQELAEFYRVESALLQAGLELEGERGLSDEGDPWFVFCRVDTGEVFIHFARVDGWYLVDGAALGGPSRGRDFGALVRDLIGRHPLSSVRRPGSNVLMHPAALLIALVGAAFFHSGRAKAAEVAHHDAADAGEAKEGRRGLTLSLGSAPAASNGEASRAVALDASEVAAVLTGVAIGLRALADAPAAAAAPAADPLAALAAPVAAETVRDQAPRGDRGGSADLLGALSSAQTRAALTVMAVVHDLARSAAPADAAVPVAASTVVVTAPPEGALRAEAPAASAVAPAPVLAAPSTLLFVHLVAGPLPQIEAVAVVTADGALARVSPDRVVHVDQLPPFLADLVSRGDVGGATGSGGGGNAAGAAAPPPGDPSLGPGDHVSVQPQPASDVQPHTTAPTQLPATDGHDAGAPTTTPVVATPAPVGNAIASAPAVTPDHPTMAGHSAAIDAAVLAFVSAVSNVQVVISGHEVVFYDPQVLNLVSPDQTVDSVTWRLEDGSSVSLIGTASELHAFHGIG